MTDIEATHNQTMSHPIPAMFPIATHMDTLRAHLPELSQQYHIKALGVFGSYVRNEQTSESDLDVLVEFEDIAQHGLLTISKIERELSAMVGVNVDLVLQSGLRRTIGQRILNEVVWLFANCCYTRKGSVASEKEDSL